MRRALIGVICIALVACGGDDDDATADTSSSTAGAVASGETATSDTSPRTTESAPGTTVAATTEPANGTTAPTTESTAETTAPSTTDDSEQAALDSAPALSQPAQLEAGVTYRLGKAPLERPVWLTNPIDGATGGATRGGFFLSEDEAGLEVLLLVIDLAHTKFLADPLIDSNSLISQQAVDAAATDPPDDYLAHFASLPGVTAGEVYESEFAGFPARALDWHVDTVEGGFPCGDPAKGNCLNVTASSVWITQYRAGDTGTTYVFELDGRPIVAEVQDRPGAQEAAESVIIGE
jgi:hypothetical protein